MNLPKLYTVQQRFEDTSIKDVTAAGREEFSKFDPGNTVKKGQNVAVGGASRGTHDLRILVKTTIACLKEMGLDPLVIPAMGSHGGGTSEGRAEVLKELGITEEHVGAENMHRYDLAKTIVPAANLIINRTPVLCGITGTENALGGTHSL